MRIVTPRSGNKYIRGGSKGGTTNYCRAVARLMEYDRRQDVGFRPMVKIILLRNLEKWGSTLF